MYTHEQEKLYKVTSYMVGTVGYIDNIGRQLIGVNKDGCGGGGYLSYNQSFVYLSDRGQLSSDDINEVNRKYVLVSYDPEKEHTILYSFSDEIDGKDQSKLCVLGTNVEFEGSIYFSEAFHDTQILKRLDLSTNTVEDVFIDDVIMAPSISPDGEMIAYTKFDGIYLYSIGEETSVRLIDIPWYENNGYHFQNANYPSLLNDIPVASWSPDSGKIIFSMLQSSKESTEEKLLAHNIYVYDFSTGDTNILLENARNPYWVLP